MQYTETIQLELPASHKLLNVVSGVLAELLAHVEDTDALHAVQLAAHEVCTNIIDHAYDDISGGRISITIHLDFGARQLLLTLGDQGHTFDPATARVADLDTPQVRGYGLHLINGLMDQVVYESDQDGNRWYLWKTL